MGDDPVEFDVEDLSPMAWRLLRVAAGYEQRAVEKELDGLMQAHVSMLENDTRSLSRGRLEELFELYRAELDPDEIRALAETF